MQDSMMIAEVGGIGNVSGSRIATPLAPPRPGRTPMMTPSRMPTIIRARLYQDKATSKPPISEAISSTSTPQPCQPFPSAADWDRSPRPLEGRLAPRWYTMCQLLDQCNTPGTRMQRDLGRGRRVCEIGTAPGGAMAQGCNTFFASHGLAYGIPETTRGRGNLPIDLPIEVSGGGYASQDRSHRRGAQPQGACLRRAQDRHPQHEHLCRRCAAAP